MTDFRDSDQRLRDPAAPHVNPEMAPGYSGARQSAGAMWGWIAGAVVLAVVLAFVFSMGGDGTQTATSPERSPAVTTGAAPKAPPATTGQSTTPAAPSGTTGQGTAK
jgi:hypothetical protein